MRQQRRPIYRIDINGPFRQGDPALDELLSEAQTRGVSVQQHIYDLLRARYLARHGQALSDLLWIPGVPSPVPLPEDPSPPPTAAAAAAAAWLDLQDE